MRLAKKIFINGKIIARTGLHIGSQNLGLSIGSTDNTVLRHPVTQEPYIPGSSLRGKLRSLLERCEGLVGEKMNNEVIYGPYTGNKDHCICKLFGVPAEKARKYLTPPSRLIVRDGHLLANSRSNDRLKSAKHTAMLYTEVKTEIVIDRITSAAMPRQLERVPASTEFELNLILNIWDIDLEKDEDIFIQTIFQGLILLQDDYLGGHGARGSGRIDVIIHSIKERSIESYKTGEAPVERNDAIPEELMLEVINAAV